MHPARLFVLCGPPGPATAARAAEIAERFAAVRVAAGLGTDDAHLRSLTVELLRVGQSVVVEWGTRSRAGRDALRSIARSAGASVHVEVLDDRADEVREGARHERRADPPPITPEDDATNPVERPIDDELALFDPAPPFRAGERPGSPAFPYGSWRP